jgi:anti-sigma regulatory factor (Ser/Thr protein kinase)
MARRERPPESSVVSATPAPAAWSWPADPASVPQSRQRVAAHLRGAGVPEPMLYDITLVVSELVTNVVLHAYVGREPGRVRVAVHFGLGELAVVVEDDGSGLRPRPDSPGVGLGLPLMAHIAERLETRTTIAGGTQIRVWFSLQSQDATPN